MGSGKLLKLAINKHGIENFTKDILFIFDTPEDAFAMEAQLVTDDILEEGLCYNLKCGGEGGFDYINDKLGNPFVVNQELCKRGRETTDRILKERYGESWRTVVGKLTYERSGLKRWNEEIRPTLDTSNPFKGRKHTEETLQHLKKAQKEVERSGPNNPMYGKCFIHNPSSQQNKTIKKDDLQTYLEQGWVKGRYMARVPVNGRSS
jgi:hypothetical protein